MRINNNFIYLVKCGNRNISIISQKQTIRRHHHGIPFVDLFKRTTGQTVSENYLQNLKKKHPLLYTLSHDRLQCTLQILKKFDITTEDACYDPHVFTMNPITMDNYGEILKECGFVKIMPKHIIRYHTLVKSRTIAWLKKESLLREDLNLEQVLYGYFSEWPSENKTMENFPDSSTNILTIRMSVLQKYLNWKLGVTADEFAKYCRNYLPLKHKPMSDIQETLDIAQNDIKFDLANIRRNGFIISSDPINTKFILQNVESIASVDIREAIRIEPAILKNNYHALLEIKSLLKEHGISEEAQRRGFKVYCMRPETVKERLDELKSLKEYQVLQTNPRVLSMVVHKRKMMNRLEKIQAAKKQCYSLNHLVASSKVFNNYISNFGNKICGRDLAILISTSLSIKSTNQSLTESEMKKQVLKQLRRHKFWLHSALHVTDETIRFLKKLFNDEVILKNCQLLLYPVSEIENYIDLLLKRRHGVNNNSTKDVQLEPNYVNLDYSALNDEQILSLVLYEIEKKYHFSGDGIWARQDGVKIDVQAS
ncbi:transcription termination factor 5, mitochondrial-like [Pectinophora gossypiella]|uniref:Transcription termination factor 5, mitochondrial n=1 Tax=Pectinophora gossypiella TaxID=13191 RepID=A0A1E1W3M8_PECGO|nr:transcription termination factor 5, mitochondrial-like [Pectinophora gossypiella]